MLVGTSAAWAQEPIVLLSNPSWTHTHDGGTGDRSSKFDFNVGSGIDDNWTASFDVTITSTNSRTNGTRNFQIALSSASASYPSNAVLSSNVLFGARFITVNNTDYSSFPCIITVNDVDEAGTVTLTHNTKYTFNVVVDGTSMAVSIKNGETSVFSKATTLAAFVKPKGIYDLLPRPYNNTWGVYTNSYENITVSKARKAVESFVVNYKLGDDIIATENVGTAGLYSGDSYTVPFRMYVEKDGALYKTTANSSGSYYRDVITLTKNTVVNKSLTAVNLNGGTLELLEDLDDSDGDNASVRASYGLCYNNKAYTSAVTLAPGVYTFIFKALNKGRGSSVKVGETTVCGIGDIVSDKGSWTDKTITGVEIKTAGKVTLAKGGSNTIDCYDIIIAIRTGDATVTKTITAAGWATYCSPYALNLADASATLEEAYIVTGGNDGVLTLTSVKDGTVPANTGLLLEGAAGDVVIPIAGSSTTNVDANKLVGVTAATELAAEDGYVLMSSPSLGFYQNANAFTVGANTAYIPVANLPVPAGARSFYSFGDATAIKAIDNSRFTIDNYYNVAGQRVAAPTKGLYIKNGKKIVVK